ncbi:hypothetical protein H6F55_08375 [Phormidium sp. FACHB-322]|nr:hypothetical protein [Leptolyngbya sp. FACHB-60]MBD1916634.1 hypothetical protein [Phormidium sp. FACHB-77]MBD2029991.1 hypothetical protein [Phormidium sp. FACHB-322]MBD2053202.1 hypothetical protein [Leptolyngbya sp. FACHB-60]
MSSQFPAQMWDDIPQSAVLTGSLNQRGQVVPWAVEQLPIPQSAPSGQTDHSGHHAGPTPTQKLATGTPVSLDAVIALA